jgi:hypothetical protein
MEQILAEEKREEGIHCDRGSYRCNYTVVIIDVAHDVFEVTKSDEEVNDEEDRKRM